MENLGELKLGCLKKIRTYLIAAFDDSTRKKDIVFHKYCCKDAGPAVLGRETPEEMMINWNLATFYRQAKGKSKVNNGS